MNEKFTNMENEIKNFDRSIEKMMNESSVAPPFGMWNRIAAQLDGEALPAPISKIPSAASSSMLTGYIAAALFLGTSFLAVYLYNSTNNTTDVTSTSTGTQEISAPSLLPSTSKKTVVGSSEEKAALSSVTRITKRTPSNSSVMIAQPEQQLQFTAISLPVPAIERVTPTEEHVPYAIVETAEYFFPPIDININDAKNSLTAKADVATDDEEKDTERKVRSGSYGNDLKFKPKKKRTKSFSYGRLNRLKNSR